MWSPKCGLQSVVPDMPGTNDQMPYNLSVSYLGDTIKQLLGASCWSGGLKRIQEGSRFPKLGPIQVVRIHTTKNPGSINSGTSLCPGKVPPFNWASAWIEPPTFFPRSHSANWAYPPPRSKSSGHAEQLPARTGPTVARR